MTLDDYLRLLELTGRVIRRESGKPGAISEDTAPILERLNCEAATGRRLTSVYDPVGNQSRRTDPRGNITTYAFDGLNRVISRKYPDGTRVTFTFVSVRRTPSCHVP